MILARVQAWDEAALAFLGRWRHPLATRLMRAFAYSGTALFWLALAGNLYLLAKADRLPLPQPFLFLNCLRAPLIAWLAANIFKRAVKRARPPSALPASASPGSFPSSHAAAAWAFGVALLRVHHPFAPFVCLWAAVVSFSRLYLGMHYPSDVLAGAAWGCVCGIALAPSA